MLILIYVLRHDFSRPGADDLTGVDEPTVEFTEKLKKEVKTKNAVKASHQPKATSPEICK